MKTRSKLLALLLINWKNRVSIAGLSALHVSAGIRHRPHFPSLPSLPIFGYVLLAFRKSPAGVEICFIFVMFLF